MKVAIGPLLNEFGGVSQHILAIQKFSSNDIRLVAPKIARTTLGNMPFGLSVYTRALNIVGLHGCDIVHSHVSPWFIELCRRSRTGNRKWVHTYHTLNFEEDYPNGLTDAHKRINSALIEVASRADVRISVSKWLHDYLLEKYAIDTEVVHNGFDAEACDKADARRIANYAWGNFVLFVGYLQPTKCPQRLVELAARMPSVNFVMLGRGLDPVHLREAYQMSIPSNLFAMGEVRHQTVLDAMSACRTFVMTSKREGLPTALMEAMYIGRPVVVPAHSGCKEIVESDEYGFLYEPNSLDDLIEKTHLALASSEVRERTRQKISEQYDWRILSKRIDSIYEWVIKV